MFLIAFRLIMALAIAFLFGLLVNWIFSLFNDSDDGGWDHGGDDPTPPTPPEPGESPRRKRGKRLVEVDEEYYLEEFDVSKK